ncbi:Hypothetical predicted protein [Podarcis lilfordi]|uniref:Uncharacterized protein n=1 Tax=Podarcis lilfordi TaxID=74358 RepID=A0AA35LGE4_9SAUR|nr:Hypothetical predicted protein [Podarcis lilfordi]
MVITGTVPPFSIKSPALKRHCAEVTPFSSLAPSPVSLPAMLTLLETYPNREAEKYIETGFRNGCHFPVSVRLFLERTPPPIKSRCPSHLGKSFQKFQGLFLPDNQAVMEHFH